MVKQQLAGLDKTFSALADPTRRAIVRRLAEGTATAGELAAPFDMSQAAVSKHLRVLEQSGLLIRERHGRYQVCRLNPEPLQGATDWLAPYSRFWQQQLDSLAGYLETPEEG